MQLPGWVDRVHTSRPRWVLPTVFAALLLAAMAIRFVSRPDLLDVPSTSGDTTAPIIVGELKVEPADPIVGQTVTFRASVVADRTMTMRRMTVWVQEPGSVTPRDLAGPSNYAVGTAERQLVLGTTFAKPGTYSYWLAYDLTGKWVSLEPFLTVTVR